MDQQCQHSSPLIYTQFCEAEELFSVSTSLKLVLFSICGFIRTKFSHSYWLPFLHSHLKYAFERESIENVQKINFVILDFP